MAKKLELLAPVGNFPMLQAAVNAGADAVYFGLKEFSMRAGARNFEIKDLAKIRAICKKSERDVKMYVTLNTIVYDEEISKIEKTISKLKNKVDAVICWDLSVIELCKKYNIPFFISTQASVANKAAALHYKKLGAKRVGSRKRIKSKTSERNNQSHRSRSICSRCHVCCTLRKMFHVSIYFWKISESWRVFAKLPKSIQGN